MEFHVIWTRTIGHEQLRGIPWNMECANFADTSSSMQFHGTLSVPVSLTRAVPWNSMKFHGTWIAPISLTQAVPWNSMEHGVCQFRWHECANFADTSSSTEFHGTLTAQISLTRAVPWNSMELHGTWCAKFRLTRAVPWNFDCANFVDMSSSMEFNGAWSAPISLTRAVPWNTMELGGRQFRWHG